MKHLIFFTLLILLIASACHKDDSKPSVFESFAGKYIVQDTFVERAQIWDSPSSYHIEDLPPSPRGQKTLTLEMLPGENIEMDNADTTLRMLLRVDTSYEYKVLVRPNGALSWSEGNYYSNNSLNGSIIGDSIQFSVIQTSLYTSLYTGDLYRGRRKK